MALPIGVWLFIFKHIHLFGWLMAFQDYNAAQGILQQEWVGLKHFKVLFEEPLFYQAIKNTLGMGALGLIFGTVSAIGFSLLINEVRLLKFKRFTQTVSYLPHFVSWVIVANIVITMLSQDCIVNNLLMSLNIIDREISFIAKPVMFCGIVTVADVWKETGWNANIYLAAMVEIDPQLYEAAKVDGVSR